MSTDFGQLAERARALLAHAADVVVLIDGLGQLTAGRPALMMQERNGLPTFVCEPDSLLVACVGKAAVLSIPPTAADDATVFLSGRLRTLSRGANVIVQLAVAEVVIELPSADNSVLSQYLVPLDLYAVAGPQSGEGHLDAMVAHANEAHQDHLSRLVLGNLGLAPGEVAGARIESLDHQRMVLRWIGSDGSHTIGVEFEPPARNDAELVVLVQETLAKAHGREHRWSGEIA